MVPPATAAHLDAVHGELLLRGVHPGQFRLGLGLSGHRTEVVAVHVVHPGQPLLAADRAGDVGRLAVVLRRSGEVRTGVTDLEQTRAAGVHVGEDGSPLQRVVHDGSTSGHGANVRTGGDTGRPPPTSTPSSGPVQELAPSLVTGWNGPAAGRAPAPVQGSAASLRAVGARGSLL